MVYKHAQAPLRDAMDLAYLTGQRPADTLSMTTFDIIKGHLIVTQDKTKQPLRIIISGKLKALIGRIDARKKKFKIVTAALVVNTQGRQMTQPALRYQFTQARDKAILEFPEDADQINNFWFYDLRAKAADDTSDERGDEEASKLLGHTDVRTTQKHYLRRGKIVSPTR